MSMGYGDTSPSGSRLSAAKHKGGAERLLLSVAWTSGWQQMAGKASWGCCKKINCQTPCYPVPTPVCWGPQQDRWGTGCGRPAKGSVRLPRLLRCYQAILSKETEKIRWRSCWVFVFYLVFPKIEYWFFVVLGKTCWGLLIVKGFLL